MNVGENTTLSDGDSRQEFVQLFIIADGQLQMSWDDSGLLIVASGVTGQLENFSREVLQDGSQVDWSSGTDSLGIVSLAKESMDTTHGELKSSTAGSALRLSLRFSSFATARHFEYVLS